MLFFVVPQRFNASSLWAAVGILSFSHVLFVPFATATYSIVATNSKTKQVGGAGATCLEQDVYEALYLSAPGKAVLHTQGWLLPRDHEIVVTAVDLMKEGKQSPGEVLESMKALDTETVREGTMIIPEVEIRQYAIADFDSTAAYSGRSLPLVFAILGFANGEVADVGKIDLNGQYNYHAAGNLVTNGTVNSLQNGFEDENDEFNFGTCDIAGKLMAAMYRVIEGGFGDVRCLDTRGKSAAGAYIHVDNADGTPYLHINEINTSEDKEPVEVLKESFLEWRKDHPCDSPSQDDPSGCSRTHVPHLFAILSMFAIASLLFSLI